jgi:hypothetical protein
MTLGMTPFAHLDVVTRVASVKLEFLGGFGGARGGSNFFFQALRLL